jgi:hypothetical protein
MTGRALGVDMPERLRGQVLYVVTPEEIDAEAEGLSEEMQELAAGRYVLVCREGGAPSWPERIKAFLTRSPIEAVTLVSDEAAEEGDDLTVTVAATDIDGVYEVVDG